jgi:hypothetical protein
MVQWSWVISMEDGTEDELLKTIFFLNTKFGESLAIVFPTSVWFRMSVIMVMITSVKTPSRFWCFSLYLSASFSVALSFQLGNHLLCLSGQQFTLGNMAECGRRVLLKWQKFAKAQILCFYTILRIQMYLIICT